MSSTRTKKQMVAAQRRSLRAIQAKLMNMSNEWGDVDDPSYEDE